MTVPRIKPNSIFLRSAQRPNPGRGVTYRRAKPVHTTGTTSNRLRLFAIRYISLEKLPSRTAAAFREVAIRIADFAEVLTRILHFRRAKNNILNPDS